MIDHVSIGVRNLPSASRFYEALMEVLGSRKLSEKSGTVGFGKHYPEFWLNERPGKPGNQNNDGCHICLRATSVETVNEFHRLALEMGATCKGSPGFRREYSEHYYAAFIIDEDDNHIEVVSFVE